MKVAMPSTIADVIRMASLRIRDGKTARSEGFQIPDFPVCSSRKEGKVWSELKSSFVGIWLRLRLLFCPTTNVLSRCKNEGSLVSLGPFRISGGAALQPDERI